MLEKHNRESISRSLGSAWIVLALVHTKQQWRGKNSKFWVRLDRGPLPESSFSGGGYTYHNCSEHIPSAQLPHPLPICYSHSHGF